MNLNFAIQIALLLIVISGVVAYIGNWVGRYFGRRRLSLFGLRPRSTATIFTLISGILIAVITFSVVLFVSRDARTAIFGLERLRTEIRGARTELNLSREEVKKQVVELEKIKQDLEKSRKESEDLTKTRERLKKQVEVIASRKVLFTAGEDVMVIKLTGGVGASKAEAALKKMLNDLDSALKKFKIEAVEVDPEDFASAVSYLANYSDEQVVMLQAVKNVASGGVLPVKFELMPNLLVYKRGEELLKAEIPSNLSASQIEDKLQDMWSQANYRAQSKGVLSGAQSIRAETPFNQIYNTAKRIKGANTLVEVKLLAAKDIYRIGPLEVEFKTNQ